MAINLVKPGIIINGQAHYFDNPAQQAIAFAQAERAGAAPTLANAPDQLPAAGSGAFYGDSDPSGVTFSPQDNGAPQPGLIGRWTGGWVDGDRNSGDATYENPSFQGATLMPNGMARPVLGNPATTKLGKLISFLGLAARGALDAAGGGALNAPRQGQSTFGEGVEAAQAMPFLRAQRKQAEERGALENQELQANIGVLPLLRAAALARQTAQTRWFNQRANANDYKVIPGVGLMQINPDGSLGGIVPGTTPQQKQQVQQNTPASRKAFADDNPELFTDDQDKSDFVLGRKQSQFSSPTEWSTRIAAAQGDPDAQAALQQRSQEEQNLARIRKADNNSQPKAPKPATRAQFAAIETKKAQTLASLEKQYEQGYIDEDQLQQGKQQAQNAYESAITTLGGTAQHYEYPAVSANAGPAANATPSASGQQGGDNSPLIIVNRATGERRQWMTGKGWKTITPPRR